MRPLARYRTVFLRCGRCPFDLWAAFGVLAQFVFGARFLVQWIASEKAEKSVIPVGFWFLSISGGLMTLVYGFARRDLVIILGQAFSIFIYIRNLMLIAKDASGARRRTRRMLPWAPKERRVNVRRSNASRRYCIALSAGARSPGRDRA